MDAPEFDALEFDALDCAMTRLAIFSDCSKRNSLFIIISDCGATVELGRDSHRTPMTGASNA